MSDEKYILSYDGECERLERQSLIFGHDRAFLQIQPERGTRLLDAGSGSGWLSRLVATRLPDCEVVGVDINPDYVAFAREKAKEAGLTNLTYEVADVTNLPFEAESFDTVWSLMVLFFLPMRRDAIKEFARVTKAGGRVIASQQSSPFQANSPSVPELESKVQTLLAAAFPDWKPECLPEMMSAAGLTGVDVQMDTDPLYTMIGSASPAQLENLRNAMEPATTRVADRLGGAEAAQEFVERWIDYVTRPDTNSMTCHWVVTGRKP